MNKYKKYIPNILTISRILATPIVVYLGITNHYILLVILASFIALTDFVDGYLARKWKVTSELGAKLDMFADKILAIGLLIILVIKNHAFFYVLLLEIFIALINLYFYFKKGIVASLLVGKLKTWVIFITIILGFVGLIIPHFKVDIFVYITLVWQIITLFCYLYYRIRSKNFKKKDIESEYLEFYELVEPLLLEKEIQKRKKFPHHIHESVYDHVLRVAFDCYKIGKRFSLDYRSLAIAGILHDFYEKPWQYNTEKTKFFEKHAFTHAKNAVDNAKRIFGSDVVTSKVEEIMITHMFPINIKFPRSREAWILTIVDKADSVDFLLHPIALFKIFLKIGGEEERAMIEEVTKETKKKMNEKLKEKKM